MYYLDNAATTKVDENVIKIVTKTLTENFGNPSSLHRLGFESEQIVKASRKVLAKALGCADKEVYFTSCGSESNNIALIGACEKRIKWADNVICTGYEHPSVEKPLRSLEKFGLILNMINPDEKGIIDTDALVNMVNSKTALVAVMQVNNEVGSIIDVVTLAEKIKAKNPRTAVHVDGVQGFLKVPFSLKNSKIDSYTVSGHKLHAPKGIGALYLRTGHNILPPFLGGGQESGIRPGTENIPYIAGFATAVEMLLPTTKQRLHNAEELVKYMRQKLGEIDGIKINSPENACPYNFNFSCIGIRSETLLHHLEGFDVYVSSGSACSKGKGSHTLTAMGLENNIIDSALRISVCKDTTIQDINTLILGVKDGIKVLSKR